MSDEKEPINISTQVKKEEFGGEADNLSEEDIKKDENIEDTYDISGLLLGGATGFGIGILISFNAIFAMEIGMFLGLIVGTRIKKKGNSKNKNV
jgi:hypothetical protein